MSQIPIFLPNLIDTSKYKDDEVLVIDGLHKIFNQELLYGSCSLRGVPIVLDRLNIIDGRENLFWHLIEHTQRRGNDGVFDHEKARRIRWIKAIIENESDSEVTVFNHQAPNKPIRTYLWVKSVHYVVILEYKPSSSKGANFALVTAFFLEDHVRERNNLQRKYDQRIIY